MLSDFQIITQRAHGNIVIEPFNQAQLGTNSYDCRLGPWYFEQAVRDKDLYLFSEEMRASWGKPRYAAKRDGKLYIPVCPGQTILCHTLEVAGGRNGIVAKMYARSTVARSGLSVCRCAGLADVGYIAIFTMEIANHTLNTIWMPVGARICQLCFYETGQTLKEYQGSYGQHTWSPNDMLPSAKGDWAVDEYYRVEEGRDEDAIEEQVM